jgi:hypothetical protein
MMSCLHNLCFQIQLAPLNPGAVSAPSGGERNPGDNRPPDAHWAVADAALGRGEVVVFAGEALTAALGG